MTTSKTESSSNNKDQVKAVSNENLAKKIVIRRLPPSMTKEQFLDIISPMPEYDFFYFCQADMSMSVNAFSRAYIYFKEYDDIFSFRDRFDNYVFLDSKSNEYPAIVEFAPYQRRYKFGDNVQKKDSKCNTINEDSDYLKFLENFDKPSAQVLPTCESILEEIEQREKERDETGATKITTPLLEYLKKKREDKKQMLKERDREAKKRREDEKRYGNSGRDKRRDRDRDYKDKGQSQNEKSSSSSQQNVKIMSRSKNNEKDQGNSGKNKESSSSQKNNDSHSKGSSKASNNSGKSTPSHSYKENRDRERANRENNNKSNSSKNSYSSGKSSGGKSYRNQSEAEHKQKNSNDKMDKTDKPEKSEKQIDKQDKFDSKNEKNEKLEAKTSKSDKLEGTESTVKVKDRKEIRDAKQKRPSIQIYNPGQRAAMREQKKQSES